MVSCCLTTRILQWSELKRKSNTLHAWINPDECLLKASSIEALFPPRPVFDSSEPYLLASFSAVLEKVQGPSPQVFYSNAFCGGGKERVCEESRKDSLKEPMSLGCWGPKKIQCRVLDWKCVLLKRYRQLCVSLWWQYCNGSAKHNDSCSSDTYSHPLTLFFTFTFTEQWYWRWFNTSNITFGEN